MASNPWMVENIEAFVYYCCPECVFRSKDESFFQSHALQNHAGSNLLFNRQTYDEKTKVETIIDEDIKQEDIDIKPETATSDIDNDLVEETDIPHEILEEENDDFKGKFFLETKFFRKVYSFFITKLTVPKPLTVHTPIHKGHS